MSSREIKWRKSQAHASFKKIRARDIFTAKAKLFLFDVCSMTFYQTLSAPIYIVCNYSMYTDTHRTRVIGIRTALLLIRFGMKKHSKRSRSTVLAIRWYENETGAESAD